MSLQAGGSPRSPPKPAPPLREGRICRLAFPAGCQPSKKHSPLHGEENVTNLASQRLSSPPDWAAEPSAAGGEPALGGRRADTFLGPEGMHLLPSSTQVGEMPLFFSLQMEGNLQASRSLGWQESPPRHSGAPSQLLRRSWASRGSLSGCSLLCCSPSELQGPLEGKGPGHFCARPGFGICASWGTAACPRDPWATTCDLI